MTQYLGDFAGGSTVHFTWHTNDSSGGAITRSTNGTVKVYKDNATAGSTGGVTDTEDFNAITGIHAVTIDLGSTAFYTTAADYSVHLEAAGISGQTVNAVLAHFSVQNRAAHAGITSILTDTSAIKIDTTQLRANSTSLLADSTLIKADLNTITGADGVTLASSQTNYAPLKGGTAMTEGYAADGATATPEQMLYMIWASLSEFAISGTTITAKKLDGSTTAMTFTLDDGTNPTSRTRAS